jgi:hypothetical protein
MFVEPSDQLPLPLQPVGKTPVIQLMLLDSLGQHYLVDGFRDHGSRSCSFDHPSFYAFNELRTFLRKRGRLDDVVAKDIGVNEARNTVGEIA